MWDKNRDIKLCTNFTNFSLFFQVVDVRINNKGVAQSKNLPDGTKGVPNFGFVVFEDEKAAADCLSQKPIYLPDGHRLNVETKKKNVSSYYIYIY